jgi:diguanylate cyclase (GGDEF)-like protein/putative nucleotidyltransferase with HDIG domain
MFDLNIHSIFQFGTLIVYVVLISLVLLSGKVALKKLFTLFLVAAAGVSLAGLLTNLRLPYEQLVFWKLAVVLFTTWSIIAYAHFMSAYAKRATGKVSRLGYGWLGVTLAVLAFGYLTEGLNLLDGGTATTYYGHAINALVIIDDALTVGILFFILNLLKKAREPEERNRAGYLLAGSLIVVLTGVLKYVIQDLPYTVVQVGYTVNAVIIAYTLMKYRLLDIQVLVRKWMVYTGVTVCMTLAYLTLLLVLSNLLRLLPPHLGIPATIVLVILFAYLFNWVKSALDKAADRLFYGSRYVNRRLLLSFAGKVSNFINIKEIANELMKPLANAIRARQVGLLLPVNDYYATKFVARLTEDEQIAPIMLSGRSLIIKWLEDSGLPLSLEAMEKESRYKQLTVEDREAISTFQIEILCPIISKQRLVAILALSKKQGRGRYTRDDLDLLTMLAKESAVAIENAQIYAHAREQADMDGLTGLHNHRAFQDLYNQEIENCAISGDDFSLLFIDLDFFKTYNDIYGHGMGDEILREVGRIIKTSIRDTDVGGRYGGDEFAVLLRGTTGEDARVVGERIRSKLETTMNEKGITLTCSVGIASWRVDGVSRSSIIQAADKAVYAAKQAGRNRVYLASEIDTVETAQPDTMLYVDNNPAIDNIVFSLASTVDARDHYTFGHSKMVSKYAAELAQAIGYDKGGLRRIRAAALLHDIGKLNLPDSILSKRGPLTDEEWEMIKNHPQLALNILKYVVGLRDCIDAVLYHHERWDGQGYPKGLKGKDIPLDARIMSIADAYDAMKSERYYKERGMTEEEALKELEKCAGTQFDPELAEVFVQLRRKSIDSALFDTVMPNLSGSN